MQRLLIFVVLFLFFVFASGEYWKKKGNNRSCRYSGANNVLFYFMMRQK